ncbi:hypothetical protein IL45_02645 [Nonlabens ulvanivorans]|uniref:Uncharacterized protein n=1 Tax=Nonlabens ulvanivorans TaxID=906888 RepID=A0A084JYN0_NONUL|nr:hypothetical protein IL45_02645 [Nonlabens ulvanivorans]PRX13050.1 hypothetical protein LY02_02108 [Nonlabens ulvanivorans]GAL74712.1 hypothetical protein JCM19275_3567 [Nonlabens ulvanivorans]
MKKRHQQKLVILSIGLVIFLNLPVIFIFNNDIDILGIPLLYAYIFFVWLLSVIITFTVLKKYG